MALKGDVKSLFDIVKHFYDFRTVGHEYSGYLEGSYAYSNFVSGLRNLGYSYAVRTSRVLNEVDSSRILYSMAQGEMKIPFLGAPFQVTKTYDMECSQGPNYKRKWTETSQYQKTNYEGKQTRRRSPSQRIGCPCRLFVKCIRIFLDYVIDEVKKGGSRQYMVMQALKKDLQDPKITVRAVERFYIIISREDAHTHPIISSPCTKQKVNEKSVDIPVTNQDTIDSINVVDNEEIVLSTDIKTAIVTQDCGDCDKVGDCAPLVKNIVDRRGLVECTVDVSENSSSDTKQCTEAMHCERSVTVNSSRSSVGETSPRKEDVERRNRLPQSAVWCSGTDDVVVDPGCLEVAAVRVQSESEAVSSSEPRKRLRERLERLASLSETVQDEEKINVALGKLDEVIKYLSRDANRSPVKLVILETQSTHPHSTHSKPVASRSLLKSSQHRPIENNCIYTCEVGDIQQHVTDSKCKLDGTKELNLNYTCEIGDGQRHVMDSEHVLDGAEELNLNYAYEVGDGQQHEADSEHKLDGAKELNLKHNRHFQD